jgi:hypothetical protein
LTHSGFPEPFISFLVRFRTSTISPWHPSPLSDVLPAFTAIVLHRYSSPVLSSVSQLPTPHGSGSLQQGASSAPTTASRFVLQHHFRVRRPAPVSQVPDLPSFK